MAAALVLLAGSAYLASPNQALGDSHYTLLLSTSLIEDRTFALDRFFRRPLDPGAYPSLQPDGLPYQIVTAQGRLYHGYPPGTALLSLPFVAALRAAGVRPAREGDVYDQRAEASLQRVIAALLTALAAGLAYVAARSFLPEGASAAVSLVAALGSPLWSTASRALGSHTWQVVLVGAVVAMLLWEERDGRRFPAWLLGTLLAWAFWVRPSAAPMIAGVGVFLAARDGPRRALGFLAGGAPWAALFLWYSLHNLGTLVPVYYSGAGFMRLHSLGTGLLGTLVSPSRGLIVFCPLVAAIAVLCVRHRRRLPSARLATLAAGVIVLHVLIAGANLAWWGGHSYGPRLHTDLVPWFVALATLTLAAARAEPGARRAHGRARTAILGALSAWGVAVHGWGAVEPATARWNSIPADVSARRERLWSWRDAQFLAGLPGAIARRRLDPVSAGSRIPFGATPEGDPYAVEGWSASGDGTRWSRARTALIAIPECRPSCQRLVLRVNGYPRRRGGRQRVKARIDGVPAGAFTVQSDAWEEVTLPLEPGRGTRALELTFPNAVPAGDDLMALRVEWIELRR